MLPVYACAGTPMNDSVLVSVATIVKQIAHHGDGPVRQEVIARRLLELREPRSERRDGDEVQRDDEVVARRQRHGCGNLQPTTGN